MLFTSLTVLTIFLTVLIGLFIFNTFINTLRPIVFFLSSWFASRRVIEDEEEEEYVDPFLTGRYDVEAYRKRMEKMRETMDEDGLFDIPEAPPKTDFTGVEIITDDREVSIDERLR